MPSYLITSPQGEKYRINAPDGATEADILGYAQQQFAQPAQPKEEISTARAALDQGIQGATYGFGDGIIDAIGALGAGAYMKAYRPELMDGNDLKGLYNEARDNSKQRLAAEWEQHPGVSLAANVAGGLSTGVGGASTKAGTAITNSIRSGNTAARIGKASLAGAASGAAYGAGNADDGMALEGALGGVAVGAALPLAIGATGAAVKAGAKAVTPSIQEGLLPIVNLAQKYKIPVALHQVAEGNAIKNFQKVSKELPFSGESAFRDSQMKAFNRELIKTTGGRGNSFTPELMDNLFNKVGSEFDNFGKGKVVNLNQNFSKATEDLIMDLEQVAPEAVEPAMKRIQKIFATADEAGNLTGEALASLRKETSRLARKASNPDISSALRDIENALIESLTLTDKGAAAAFSATKQKYKNLLVLEPLAAKAKGGNISPTQLQSRVSKIYGRQFVRGKAGEIGDLARIGNEIMPELGGSDTVQKAIYAGGMAGAAMNLPLALANAGKTATVLGGNRLLQAGLNRNQAVVRGAAKRTAKQIANNPQKALP